MSIFGKSKGHFRALIDILPLGPNTRSSHAYNGIRWSFVYAEDLSNLGVEAPHSDVWPEFVDAKGHPIQGKTPLTGQLEAIMHIVSQPMVKIHLDRLKVGSEFYCMESVRCVGRGVVTSLTV